MEIDKVSLAKPSLYLVRFGNTEDHSRVVAQGVYYFNRKPMVVKPWNPELDVPKESIVSLPFGCGFLDLNSNTGILIA